MLGTVGVESPCFQLEKALKKLALDAADPEAYAEVCRRGGGAALSLGDEAQVPPNAPRPPMFPSI